MIDIIVKHGKHLYIKWKDRKKENEIKLERNNNSNNITTKHEIFLLQYYYDTGDDWELLLVIEYKVKYKK